ncbi:hypothetical protein ES319_A01G233800v1 [Gossypium barbadense]|uniref:Transmembrane protein n=2 Tax=Gossypium TaxID=3633 RepID=A0A5J5X1M3_GOSBA|nr:hypothetical protein ES319_A01G233800v1 [Gossypium barbadense]TYH32431.1 hypothetical protein ES288_A01G252200v1 [Gossypium darwinii]
MAWCFLLCLVLLFNASMAVATIKNGETKLHPQASTPTIRTLGKHEPPVSSPSQALPHTNNGENMGGFEGKAAVHLQKHQHHSMDKSIAGGGVILGGLATTFLVAVFCYVRATRRHK